MHLCPACMLEATAGSPAWRMTSIPDSVAACSCLDRAQTNDFVVVNVNMSTKAFLLRSLAGGSLCDRYEVPHLAHLAHWTREHIEYYRTANEKPKPPCTNTVVLYSVSVHASENNYKKSAGRCALAARPHSGEPGGWGNGPARVRLLCLISSRVSNPGYVGASGFARASNYERRCRRGKC